MGAPAAATGTGDARRSAAGRDDPRRARVEHLLAKEALLGQAGEAYFTTPHFDGHPSILVRLDVVPMEELRELIVEAWLWRAPKRLASAYLAEHPPS